MYISKQVYFHSFHFQHTEELYNQHNPASCGGTACEKLPASKIAAYYHMNTINFACEWHHVSRDEYTAVRAACKMWRDVLCWKPEEFMVYATSASNLTALAVFKLVSECFCGKREGH